MDSFMEESCETENGVHLQEFQIQRTYCAVVKLHTAFVLSSSSLSICLLEDTPSSPHPSSSLRSPTLPSPSRTLAASVSIISPTSLIPSSSEALSSDHLLRTAVILSLDIPSEPRALAIASWTAPTLTRYSSPAFPVPVRVGASSVSRVKNICTSDLIESMTSFTTETTSRIRVAPWAAVSNRLAQWARADV